MFVRFVGAGVVEKMTFLRLIAFFRSVPMLAVVVGASAYGAIAGSTPGTLDVGPSGSAKYSVPISVPAGIGGLEPRLSFEYDSQAGRGIASTGWSLGGISAVRRCTQTIRQDGKRRGINLSNDNDRFCLDGQRLVLDVTSAAYGANNAIYRTEVDTFARITSIGSAGGGPQSFRVEAKDGLTSEYGSEASGRLIPGPAQPGGTQPSVVAMWSISRTVDRVGNEIAYTYAVDPASGSQLLDRITYNLGKAYVRFTYVDDLNPRVAFIAGTRVTHAKLLKQVQTSVLDDASVERAVKTYTLDYDFFDVKGSTTADRPAARLRAITECGADAQCLAPITFGWATWSAGTDRAFKSSYQAGVVGAFPQSTWNDDRVKSRRFADMNRDGKMDIVGFGDDGVYVLFSKPGDGSSAYESNPIQVINAFGDSQGWTNNFSGAFRPRHLVDMNRDGYPDIVGISNIAGSSSMYQGIYVSYWDPAINRFGLMSKVTVTGGDFFTTGWGTTCTASNDLGAPKYLADMNGDGYPDMVGFHQDGVYVSFWNGTQFSAPKQVSGTNFRMRTDEWLGPTCLGTDFQPIFLEDMNGDGFPDIVGVNVVGVYVALWNPGVESFDPALPLYGGVTAQGRNTTQYPVQMADMNADGYPDLVQFAADGINVALWSGAGFNPVARWTTSFSGPDWADGSRNPRRIADINGDGFPDVIGFANDGIYVLLSNGLDGFSAPTRWTTQFPSRSTDADGNVWDRADLTSPRYVLDMDGDGLPDVVGLGTASTRWASAVGAPGTRIIGITDSLGAVTTMQYSLSQEYSGFYANDQPAAAWPLRDAHGPTLVVTEIARDDGIGGYRKTRYRYGGRKIDFNSGPLGFHWMATRDEASGIESRTEFEQIHPHVGWPKVVDRYRSTLAGESIVKGCSNSVELCAKTFTVNKVISLNTVVSTLEKEILGSAGEYAGNPRYFAYTSVAAEARRELDGTAMPSKTTTFEYKEPLLVSGGKQWGNLTRRTVGYGDGHSTDTINTYEPAVESTWTLGRLSRATAASTRPARTIAVAAASDAPLPPGAAGPLPVPEMVPILSNLLRVTPCPPPEQCTPGQCPPDCPSAASRPAGPAQ